MLTSTAVSPSKAMYTWSIAGIHKRVHAHGLRHTHAAQLQEEGVDIGIISKQLGHASISTTARYLDHYCADGGAEHNGPSRVVTRVVLKQAHSNAIAAHACEVRSARSALSVGSRGSKEGSRYNRCLSRAIGSR